MKHRIVQALAGLLVLSFACRATAEDYEHYTRYVESDGTQSIDLGFTLSSDMTIECVFEQLYKKELASYQGLFGARTDANTENISAFSMKSQDGNVFCGECQTGGNDSYKTYRTRFDRTADSFYLHRNLIKRTPTEGWTLTDLTTGQSIVKSKQQGQYEGQIWNGETFSTAETAMLFEIRGTAIGGETWSRAAMRLYLLRVSDSSGKVLHEIIPDQEGDRIGVRDTVTGAYLYSAEGNPLKIVETAPLSVQIDSLEPTPPGDYDVALDCLISDGSQWIETGVTLDNEMTIDIDCVPLGFGQNEMRGVFGVRSDPACSNISVLVTENGFAYVDFNDAACIGGNRETWAVTPSAGGLSDGVRSNFHLSKTERSITNLETGKRLAVNAKLWNDHPFSTESTAQIFGIAGWTGAHAKMKLYRVKIANNEGVLHNYFPVQKNGVAGLYDCVTGDFLMNAGEGEFDYTCEGTPLISEGTLKSFVTAQVPWQDTTTVTTVVRPINVGSPSYVESDGTQEIDLGFKLKSDMNIEVVFAGVGAVPATQGFFGARGSGANDLNIALFRGKDTSKPTPILSADCQSDTYSTYRMADASVDTGVVYRATLKDGGWTLTDETSGAPIGKSKKPWDRASFETPGNALLFRINGTTIDDSAWARAKVRICSVVVRDKDGTLLHDLVPSVNEAGVAGLFDRASADAANAWKFPAFGNPLTFVGARFAPDAPRAYTNVVGRVDESCKLPVTMSPLRPGTAYEWFAFAEDQRGDFVSSPTTNTFTTVSDAAPAGATLSLKVEVLVGRTKAGHLRLRLTRTDTANAAAVTLVAGKDYGGADPANWRNVMACGSFAAGEAAIVVDTPFLPKDTNYLRAFTADGEWSETVFIPETDFVPGKQQGLAIIVR